MTSSADSAASSPTALITGGAVRVGRAISLALAGRGMRVVVHYNRSAEPAEELVEQIRAGGGEAVVIGGDLSRHAEVQRVAREAEAAFGGIDILVNNASVFPEEALSDVDEALWDETLAVNLKAPFFLTQALGARMRERGEGVVINMVDLAGLQPWARYAAHGVSKAGLVHLTRVAARALAPEVRVIGIAPGTVLPPDDLPAEELERLARRTVVGTIGGPDDVVRAVLYAIDAPFVTGEIMVVDGGRMLK